MKAAYLPTTLAGKMLHLAEEAAELSKALLKTLRVAEKSGMKNALHGYNPELPESERETNLTWISRELEDVLMAKDFLLAEKLIHSCISGTPHCHFGFSKTFRCSSCKKTECWCDGGYDGLCSSCSNIKEKKRESRAKKTSRAKPRQHPAPGRKKPQRLRQAKPR